MLKCEKYPYIFFNSGGRRGLGYDSNSSLYDIPEENLSWGPVVLLADVYNY